MFFEASHSALTDFYKSYAVRETESFPLHMHEALECYIVTRGKVLVTVDGQDYLLGGGEGVLVFPYQRHSYEVLAPSENLCCLFSADFAPAYMKDKDKLLPENAHFAFPLSRLPMRDGYLAKKAFVYELLSVFDEGRTYLPRRMSGQNALLSRIFHYLSEHIAEDCSLRAIAEFVGYEYTYLSKHFKRATGISLHDYINALRIGRAKTLLWEGDAPIHLIAEQCGFASLRSFNRVFLEKTGYTPGDYRAGACSH